MSQIKFSEIKKVNNNNEEGYTNRVSFFTLKNDGDEAIVRFMHNTPDDFEIYRVHNIKTLGKFGKQVNCLRNGDEPLDKCPFCNCDNSEIYNTRDTIVIHMIQYVKDENGKIIGNPVIWNRNVGGKNCWATKLSSYMNEYGNLSEFVFKIKRNGSGLDTTYDIIPTRPEIYKNEDYPIDWDAFKDYKALGIANLNKSAEEMNVFLETGAFPEKQINNATSNKYVPKSEATFNPVNGTITDEPVTRTVSTNNTNTTNRPVRRY